MHASSKIALSFAGLTVVLALAAALGAGSFMPSDEPQAEPAPVAEVAAKEPVEEEPSWAEEGLSDDWGSAGTGGGWAGSGPSDSGEPNNDEISPEASADNGFAGSTAGAQGNAGANGKGKGKEKVTSQAAIGAPSVRPPGAKAASEVTVAD